MQGQEKRQHFVSVSRQRVHICKWVHFTVSKGLGLVLFLLLYCFVLFFSFNFLTFELNIQICVSHVSAPMQWGYELWSKSQHSDPGSFHWVHTGTLIHREVKKLCGDHKVWLLCENITYSATIPGNSPRVGPRQWVISH